MNKIKIEITGILVKFSGDIAFLKSKLHSKRIKVLAFGRGAGRKLRKEVEYVPLFTEDNDGSIYTGLGSLKLCSDILESSEIELTSNQDINLEEIKKEIPEGLKLRSYQDECVDIVINSRCGVIMLPTASGKTEILLSVANSIYKSIKKPILILAPTLQGLSEIYTRAISYGIKSMSYKKYKDNPDPDIEVIVSTPIVLYNDLVNDCNNKLYDNIQTLIIDEVHRSSCVTYTTILKKIPYVKRVYGFSATPLDNRIFGNDYKSDLLVSLAGNILYERKAGDEEISCYLNEPVLIDYILENSSDSLLTNNNWNEYTKILDNEERLLEIVNIINCCNESNLKTITFVNRKAPGRFMLKNLTKKSMCWFGSSELIFNYEDIYLEIINLLKSDMKKFNNKIDYKFTFKFLDENKNFLELDNKILTKKLKEVYMSDFIKMIVELDLINNIIVSQHANECSDISSLDVAILQEGRKHRVVVQRAGRALRKSKSNKSYLINITDSNVGVLNFHSRRRSYSMKTEYNKKVSQISTLGELKECLSKVN